MKEGKLPNWHSGAYSINCELILNIHMPRPKNKEELIHYSQKNFQMLKAFLSNYSEEDQMTEFPEGTRDRNIRDVLAHLHHWHCMMQEWYTIGMSGDRPAMPAQGYTWKTTAELNRRIREQYQDYHLKDINDLLNQSFENLQEIIQSHSNEELFEKKRYKWTGTTSLGAYLVSATSSHYDWALKLIKKAKK